MYGGFNMPTFIFKKKHIAARVCDEAVSFDEKARMAYLIRTGIKGEYDTIAEYQENIKAFQQAYDTEKNEVFLNLIKIYEDIIREEQLHVGELNKALSLISPAEGENLKKGEEEAAENIQDTDTIKAPIVDAEVQSTHYVETVEDTECTDPEDCAKIGAVLEERFVSPDDTPVADNKIQDLALARNDAMDRCISLGKKFIEHFDKVYKNSDDSAKNHWLSEMDSWYKSAKAIKLKNTNDYLLNEQLMDWFFTAGANAADFMTNPDSKEIRAYDTYVIKLLNGGNVKDYV